MHYLVQDLSVAGAALQVYEWCVQGLFAGKAEIIPGVLNVVTAAAVRLLPKGVVESVAAGLYKVR
ncbi:hypothetical protein [Chitinophaga agrisoli]|uniref:hypothetical protein n=1 Tax=Chitinophaga agrisoli TaxID=2607653 RepID=UPI001BCA156F|nr:hypothetical protein [Chitinophaga agrisoli]